MDLQAFVDCCSVPCAVLSVWRDREGTCERILIERANASYKQVMGPAYYDSMPYQELVPEDTKFEDFCYRAAFLGQRMHAYVQTKALGTWTDQVMIPMEPMSEDVGLCQFLFEFTEEADPSRMASISLDTASAVIEASMTLFSASDFRAGVDKVVGDIREMSEATVCSIDLMDHVGQTSTTFARRLAPGVRQPMGSEGLITYEASTCLDEMIGVSNALIVKGPSDRRRLERQDASWARLLDDLGIESVVLVPLRSQQTTLGYLYVTNFNVARLVEVKELLELMSYILASELSNHLLLEQLDRVSRIDALCEIGNRRAMESRMEHVRHDTLHRPFGIVSLDLNGLKTMNDHYGHEAGDRLLVMASKVLTGVFDREDVYRSGGDEFVVIAHGMERDAFHAKLRHLGEVLASDDVVRFAMGSYWSNGSLDVEDAYRRADELMYVDKRAFYAEHPELRMR